ncbi:MAG: hypothetical protein KBC81_03785 [Candidatus Pacebacteria bacterium]|nr:hypothetical protein [Candidatus Paceibacterota bacterium]
MAQAPQVSKNRDLSIQEVEKLRSKVKATLTFAFVLVCIRVLIALEVYFQISQVQSHALKQFLAMFAIGAGGLMFYAMILLHLSVPKLAEAWRAFAARRYGPFYQTFHEEGYEAPWQCGIWKFLTAPSLQGLEDSLVDGLRAARTVIDRERRQERWDRTNVWLRKQFDAILDDFSVPQERRVGYLSLFETSANPRKRREYLQVMAHKLALQEWLAKHPAVEVSAAETTHSHPSSEDIELRSMEVRASHLTNPKALYLYQRAKDLKSRRERIRLLGEALREDESGAEKNTASQTPVRQEAPKVQHEIKHVFLQEFVRERLSGMKFLVGGGVDWEMCREVVLVPLQPGRRDARFNKHYFAEDTVRETVERQYRLSTGRPFRPAEFKRAVSRLIDLGVLVTKAKTDERTISLSTRTKGSGTSQGAEIVSMILKLKRELSGLG